MPPVAELTQGVQKQQLGSFIFNLQAEEFPFSSIVKKGADVGAATFTNTVSRRSRMARTGVPNGADVSEFGGVKRSPVTSYIQEFRATWGLDQRAKVTEYGGVAKGQEKAFQKVQGMLILRQLMEQNGLSNDEMQLATETLGYEARGGFKWVSPSEQSVNPVPSDYRPDTDAALIDTTVAAVTEAKMEAMIDSIFRKRMGGNIKLTGFVAEKLQAGINKFSVVANSTETSSTYPVRRWDQEKGVVLRAVTRLVFSHGTVDLMSSPHIITTKGTGEDSSYTKYSGLFCDMSTWDTRWQQQIEDHELEEKGGGPHGYYNCMMAFICGQPAWNGCVTAES